MDLATMRTLVRRDLHDEDTANQRWSNNELDRHIARALGELSLAAPRELTATLTATAGSRDVSAATLTSRVSIDAVEYPAGQYPPAYAGFSLWGDTLTLLVDAAPAGAESVVVRYAALHTLDSSSSTLPAALEDVLAGGAAGYAALEWSSFATNRVNAGGDTTGRDYHAWAQERLAAFHGALARHGRERQLRSRRLYVPAAGAAGVAPFAE